MSDSFKYRIAARTEAAGKYDPSAPQEGNEDNYGLIGNVAHPDYRPDFDCEVDLGNMGLLMFVADGMGGHNAGEVASRLAVDTVYEAFSNDQVQPDTAASHTLRSQYLEAIICNADKRIRTFARQHKECEGMGSTLIIAWLVGDELTVSWCGDSRCYLYRPHPSPCIAMVSEDHSYVQELVQRGVIPYEATFGHPRGNIVTRCLGGGGDNANPESRMVKVGRGDIVLLCSDGLSGVLFDDGRLFDGSPITDENICDTISTHRASMRTCLQELFAAAERGGWYDNVTAIACELTTGPEPTEALPTNASGNSVSTTAPRHSGRLTMLISTLAVLLIAIVVAVVFLFRPNEVHCKPHVAIVSPLSPIMVTMTGSAEWFHVIVKHDKTIQYDTIITDSVFVFPQPLRSDKTYDISVQAICGNDTSRTAMRRLKINTKLVEKITPSKAKQILRERKAKQAATPSTEPTIETVPKKPALVPIDEPTKPSHPGLTEIKQ